MKLIKFDTIKDVKRRNAIYIYVVSIFFSLFYFFENRMIFIILGLLFSLLIPITLLNNLSLYNRNLEEGLEAYRDTKFLSILGLIGIFMFLSILMLNFLNIKLFPFWN